MGDRSAIPGLSLRNQVSCGHHSVPPRASLPMERGRRRDDDPRLAAQRDDRPLRDDEHRDRRGPLRLQEGPQGHRRAAVLQDYRPPRPAPSRGPRSARQRLGAQRASGHRLVSRSEAHPLPSALRRRRRPHGGTWSSGGSPRSPSDACVSSLAQLTEAIELWAKHWNGDPKPFVGHKPATEIVVGASCTGSSQTRCALQAA